MLHADSTYRIVHEGEIFHYFVCYSVFFPYLYCKRKKEFLCCISGFQIKTNATSQKKEENSALGFGVLKKYRPDVQVEIILADCAEAIPNGARMTFDADNTIGGVSL